MVSKPRVKTQKDKKQDQRIAKLERQFPTVNEVVSTSIATTFTDTVVSKLSKLLPVALDDEKVEFRGFNLRRRIVLTTGATNGKNLQTRLIIFMYKCTADYSGASPVYIVPAITDIVVSADPLSHLNQDNLNRMKILYDNTVSYNALSDIFQDNRSRMYKKTVSLMPITDKAFVWRLFVLELGFGTTATETAASSMDINILTRQ